MRISSIIGNRASRTCILAAALFFSGVALLHAAECSTSKGIPSNNVRWLVGSGDTLWLIAYKGQAFALSMLAGKDAISDVEEESNWWSYSLACYEEGIYDIATGGGYAVASVDSMPNVLWRYSHETGRTKEYTLSWPDADEAYDFTVVDISYSGEHFYCAAYNGGLVRWDHLEDEKTVFFPGKSSGYTLGELKRDTIPEPDSMTAVTGVESLMDDSQLLVTTPEHIWLFSTDDTLWDSSAITDSLDEPGAEITQFRYVFVNRRDSALPLYAIVDVRLEGMEQDTSWLCKYNRRSRIWEMMLSQAPKSITFGWNNTMFMLFDDDRPGSPLLNIARLYNDIPGDTGCIKEPSIVEDEQYFRRRMTRAYDIDYPDELTDILFVPKNDSTGYLWIATSEGLFFSANETPGTDTASFLLVKRAPSVGAGLKTTYARPGILTPTNDRCVFIYNIKKASARVTIRVYDYNMDLVKTVLYKEERSSGNAGGPLGRSTVESQDHWDGRNESGRRCAPGIYYYKITTDSGERAFGKIVIAR